MLIWKDFEYKNQQIMTYVHYNLICIKRDVQMHIHIFKFIYKTSERIKRKYNL